MYALKYSFVDELQLRVWFGEGSITTSCDLKKNEKSPSLEQKCRGILARFFFSSPPPTFCFAHIITSEDCFPPLNRAFISCPFVFLKHFFHPLALHHIVRVGYRFIRERLTGQKERFFANENHFLSEQAANPGEHHSLCGLRWVFFWQVNSSSLYS